MKYLTENYREFENNRLIYALVPTPTPEPETEPEKDEKEKKGPETTEDLRKAGKDISEEIETKELITKGHVELMLKNYIGHKYEESAKKFGGKMDAHIQMRFAELQKEYMDSRDEMGTAVAKEKPGEFKKIYEKAEKLKNKITKHLKNKSEHEVEYLHLQDKMAKATKGLSDETPESMAQKEKIEKPIKAEIVSAYLQREEGINGNMADELGRLLVESGEINVNYEAKDLNRALKRDLKGRLKGAVDSLLAESPSAEVKPQEKTLFIEMIQKDPDLIRHFGEDVSKGSYLNKTATALAKRFDVHFEEDRATPKYVVDLNDYSVHKYDKTTFKDVIDAIKLEGPDEIDDYIDDLDDKNKDLATWREEIKEGHIRALGGEIKEWGDFAGHEAANNLLAKNKGIHEQVTKIEEELSNLAKTESAEQRVRELKENYLKAGREAGLVEGNTRFTKLKTAKYQINIERPDFEKMDAPKGTITLKGIGTELAEKAVITLDSTDKDNPKITVRVEGEGETLLNKEYTPAEFKKIKDIQALIEDPEKNIKINKKKADLLSGRIQIINDNLTSKKGPEIKLSDLPKFTNNELASDTFNMPIKITVNGIEIGEIMIDASEIGETTKEEGVEAGGIFLIGNSKVALPWGGEIKLDELTSALKEQSEAIVEIAKITKENKEQISKQIATNKIEAEGLEFKSVEPKGNFANDDAEILISSVLVKNKQVATVYMKAGGKEGERGYVVDIDGEKQVFANVDEVNKHLSDNKDKFQTTIESFSDSISEYYGKIERVDLNEGNEAARANLIKVLNRYFPNSLALLTRGAISETGEFEEWVVPWATYGINKFINSLDSKRIKELEAPDTFTKFRLEKKERKNLEKYLEEGFEMEYGKIERTDKEEMKLVNGLEVTVNGKTQKLSKLLGEDFASILSMRYEIKKGTKENTIKIIKDGKELEDNVAGDKLGKYLSPMTNAAYQKILKGEISSAEELADLKLTFASEKMWSEMIKQISKTPEQLDAFKNMNFFQFIAAFGKLVGEILKAFKTKDPNKIKNAMKDAEDAMKDIREGRSPNTGIQLAEKSYKETLEQEDDLRTLLEINHNPRGEKANEVLGEKTSYRSQARNVIKAKFERTIGMTIASMESQAGGSMTKIRGLRGGKTYEIYIDHSEGTPITMSRYEMKTTKEGVEYRDEEEAGKLGYIRQEVDNLSGGTESLVVAVGFKRAVAPEVPTEPTEGEEEEKPEKETELAKNIGEARSKLDKMESGQIKTLTESIKPEGFDLAKETEAGFAELRKKPDNLRGGKIKQEAVDTWRKELIAEWVKDGKVTLDKIT